MKEGKDLTGYEESLKNSELTKQLKRCRSLRATYEKGVICGMSYAVSFFVTFQFSLSQEHCF